LLDYRSDMYDAKEEGREEEKLAITIKLITLGMDMAMVIQVTRLRKEDIIQLQIKLPKTIAAPTKE
jgi:hypothetical protein